MTIAMRTSVAISSGGISAQLIRLLPPAGCPGEAVWVPPNEVQRWEQLGFGRAPIPAAELELSWQPAGPELGGLIPIELLLNPRTTPSNAVTVDWGDGTAETLPWPVGGDGNGRLQHGYASRRDYKITAELSGNGITAAAAGEPGGLLDLVTGTTSTWSWSKSWPGHRAAFDPWCWPKWRCLRRQHNPAVEPDAMEWRQHCWWCAN